MIIIKIKEGEKIDRALRRYKNKIRDTKMLVELRERKTFKKKSVKNRIKKNKAIYIQKIKESNN